MEFDKKNPEAGGLHLVLLLKITMYPLQYSLFTTQIYLNQVLHR
jgi:hypothetical protein